MQLAGYVRPIVLRTVPCTIMMNMSLYEWRTQARSNTRRDLRRYAKGGSEVSPDHWWRDFVKRKQMIFYIFLWNGFLIFSLKIKVWNIFIILFSKQTHKIQIKITDKIFCFFFFPLSSSLFSFFFPFLLFSFLFLLFFYFPFISRMLSPAEPPRKYRARRMNFVS